jgi:putative Holliday junction resolvase
LYPSWVQGLDVNDDHTPTGRALGIDYGQKRIGLALSDASGLLARPWKAIAREGNAVQVAAALAQEVRALAASDEPVSVVVVGYPRRLSGEATEQTIAVRKVVDRLKALLTVPVRLQDERLSSHEAEELLARREKDWRKRKLLLDAMSAAVILQDYLDAAGARRAGLGTEDGHS